MIKIGDWIGVGWRTVTTGSNFWGFVVLVLAYLAAVSVGNFILAGPATVAVYAVCLYALRTGKFDFNRVTEAFQAQPFVQSLLVYLVISAMIMVPAVILAIPFFLMLPFSIQSLGSTPSAEPPIAFFASLGVFYLLLFIITIILHLLYLFPYFLIADRKMLFWDAMEASRKRVMQNLGGFFLFVLALGGINLLGMLACGVGILVTAPVTWCAIAAAYRDLWPEPQPEAVSEPVPTPMAG